MRFLITLSCLAVSSVFAADPFDQSKVPLEIDTKDRTLSKIVLLAGSPSNKSGQHEYFAGCALMMDWLKQTPKVFPVMARDGWPKNEKIFERAKSIVVFMDGGAKQTFLEPTRWNIIKQHMEAGTGLVVLHQAVDFPLGPEQEVKLWLGGVWLKDKGCRGHWDMSFNDIGDHPILRGVKPFSLKGDGWLYNLHFAEKTVPLLSGTVPDSSRTTRDAKNHTGRPEVVAWSYERENGGRSFAFTGCDLHRNWEVESQRKLVVNGILWTAKLPIPPTGAPVDFTPADLQKNLDKKSPPASTK